MNFNKCFVLSTESFKPVGPWAEMARSNYCGDETVYLGVRLSKQLSPLKDWKKVILKMKKVGAAIKKRGWQFSLKSKDGQYLSNSMHGIFSEIQTDSKICCLLDVEIHPLSSGCLCQHKNLHSYLMLSSLGLEPPTAPSNPFQLGPPHFLSTNEERLSEPSFHWSHAKGCPFCSPKPLCQSCVLVRPLKLLIPICLE